MLRGERLVVGERCSRHVFYALADDHVRDMLKDMVVHINEDREGRIESDIESSEGDKLLLKKIAKR
ncbi:hypothetical protein [Oceanospirillum maris]|uniref:hypothetical protein n=1 Tax=Oceanospirillum maris TaxID=64977 RepID=UPI003CCBC6CF